MEVVAGSFIYSVSERITPSPLIDVIDSYDSPTTARNPRTPSSKPPVYTLDANDPDMSVCLQFESLSGHAAYKQITTCHVISHISTPSTNHDCHRSPSFTKSELGWGDMHRLQASVQSQVFEEVRPHL